MTAPRNSTPVRPAGALLLLLMLLAAACGGSPQVAPLALGQPVVKSQKIVIRVLDTDERSVKGARLEITPVLGRLETPGPYVTGPGGRLELNCLPAVTPVPGPPNSRDRVTRLDIALSYVVQAPGFLPSTGRLVAQETDRRLSTPGLSTMTREARFTGLNRVVYMQKPEALLGPNLKKAGIKDPVSSALLGFYITHKDALNLLGTSFGPGSLDLKKGTLVLMLNWRGPVWSSLDPAPLTAQATVQTALPLAWALGRDLLPLSGVDKVELRLKAEDKETTDKHAISEGKTLIYRAPAAELIRASKERNLDRLVYLTGPPKVE